MEQGNRRVLINEAESFTPVNETERITTINGRRISTRSTDPPTSKPDNTVQSESPQPSLLDAVRQIKLETPELGIKPLLKILAERYTIHVDSKAARQAIMQIEDERAAGAASDTTFECSSSINALSPIPRNRLKSPTFIWRSKLTCFGI